MKSQVTKVEEHILKQILDDDAASLSSKNPMVLSCGGIFIPQRERSAKVSPHHILTTLNKELPVKVVSGTRPKNILQALMDKESQN